jgi:hypothetical protein
MAIYIEMGTRIFDILPSNNLELREKHYIISVRNLRDDSRWWRSVKGLIMWRRCYSNEGAVSAHLPYAVSQSQVGLAIVKPIDRTTRTRVTAKGSNLGLIVE